MARYTKLQQQAFLQIERRFKRPLTAITVADLDPNPQLVDMVTLYGGLGTAKPLTIDQHKRLLYQAWLISRVRA